MKKTLNGDGVAEARALETDAVDVLFWMLMHFRRNGVDTPLVVDWLADDEKYIQRLKTVVTDAVRTGLNALYAQRTAERAEKKEQRPA